jgi:hypothetical protein
MDVTTMPNNQQSDEDDNASLSTIQNAPCFTCKHCAFLNNFHTRIDLENHYKLVHQFKVVVTLLNDDGEKDPENGK